MVATREFAKVLIPLVIASGVWVFIKIAAVATADSPHELDERVLLWFRASADVNDPIGPAWLEEMARDITALGSVALLSTILMITVGFVLLRKEYRKALFLLLSVPGGIALSFILKSTFDRPRPDLTSLEVQTFTSSFPSAHSMAAAITFLTLGAVLSQTQKGRRTKVYLISVAGLLTMLIGLSRIYLGVHWPTDVVAGWVAGAAWALMCWLLARVMQRSGTAQSPR